MSVHENRTAVAGTVSGIKFGNPVFEILTIRARKMGVNRATLIRLAVLAYLEIDNDGQPLSLPEAVRRRPDDSKCLCPTRVPEGMTPVANPLCPQHKPDYDAKEDNV